MTTTTLNPLTAPIEQVYDWLAERDGWRITHRDGRLACVPYLTYWRRARDGSVTFQESHPITLDRMSEMLPKDRMGWRWVVVQKGSARWIAGLLDISSPVSAAGSVAARSLINELVYPTEREARARVLAAVLMKEGQA